MKWKKFIWLMITLFSIFLLHPALHAEMQQELTVSAAISLKNVFDEIGKAFEAQHSGTKVRFNFGASGDLKKQIEGGAPVDLFASASLKEMDDLSAKNMILKDTVVIIAKNSIVLIQPAHAGFALKSFNDLTTDAVKKIAIGNPKTVPAGRYAEETLNYLKLFETLKGKFIFAENVRQVLDYVARDEVDAGIVYLTDALVLKEKVVVAAKAPEESHKPVIYPIAVLKGTKNESLARKFEKTVASDTARTIFEKYGFKKTTP